ncbi:MAG: hypothetical protein QM731_18010 [Chitinophagaceae bacterium]
MERVVVSKEKFRHYSGEALKEYALVIYPDAYLTGRIIEERQQFVKKYGAPISSIEIPAYITVAEFSMRDGMEPTLMRWLQRICSMYHGFRVTLGNYNGTPADTIFIQGHQLQPFQQLGLQLKTIDEYIRSSSCPPVHIAQQPCLQFAAALSEEIYRKAMPVYARQIFRADFEVNELVLLARDHAFHDGKEVQVFRFLPAVHHPETIMA